MQENTYNSAETKKDFRLSVAAHLAEGWGLGSYKIACFLVNLFQDETLLKLCTKADSYSSAETEAGICNLLMLQGQLA